MENEATVTVVIISITIVAIAAIFAAIQTDKEIGKLAGGSIAQDEVRIGRHQRLGNTRCRLHHGKEL